MKKTLKRLLVILLLAFIVIQFFRPEKNLSAAVVNDISTQYVIPQDVHAILSKACYDCHSNKTSYPWYASVQPVAWWLNDHVKDGKKEFNFNEFAAYRKAKQYHKLEECIEQVKEKKMPLSSYTLIHRDASLTDAERSALTGWFQSIRDSMQAKYPVDSLVVKKK